MTITKRALLLGAAATAAAPILPAVAVAVPARTFARSFGTVTADPCLFGPNDEIMFTRWLEPLGELMAVPAPFRRGAA